MRGLDRVASERDLISIVGVVESYEVRSHCELDRGQSDLHRVQLSVVVIDGKLIEVIGEALVDKRARDNVRVRYYQERAVRNGLLNVINGSDVHD